MIAAERQRGSTLFLTTPANRLATCATYISSRISISVIRSVGRSVGADVAFPGGKLLAKQGGSTKNRLTYAHSSAFDFHAVKFWSSAYTKTLWHLQVIMELFLSANIHQGNDLFSVYSRGRQCAFMCLSALLTARNNPVVVWSKQR